MKPSITFVSAVESGPLETQLLRMVASLRQFGGAFAQCPVWAVKPRCGPPIAKATRREFDRLNIEFKQVTRNDAYGWYSFLNKTRVVRTGDDLAATEFVGWLDADLLFTGEPTDLCPGSNDDIVACSPDNPGGTTGPGDVNESFWREACHSVNLDIDAMPWVTTEREQQRIRLYWNGGIFIFRRACGLADEYEQCTVRLLEARVASATTGIFFLEQCALGMAAVRLGLRRRQLPHSHNFEMGSAIHARWYAADKLRSARIVHYHDCMWPAFWPEFIKCLDDTHPAVAAWLTPQGPLSNRAPLAYRIVGKLLRRRRQRAEREFRSLCRVL